MKKQTNLQSIQNGVADFNYFVLYRVNQLINKVIKVISSAIYCLITRLIIINIAPLTELFCNCPLADL